MELKDKAYYYRNSKDLKDLLLDSDLSLNASENYQKFLPNAVMDQFKKVFID